MADLNVNLIADLDGNLEANLKGKSKYPNIKGIIKSKSEI